jgi:hypothetical protein
MQQFYTHLKMNFFTLKNKKSEEWIQKDLKNKISKSGKKAVFVPSLKELFFDHSAKSC